MTAKKLISILLTFIICFGVLSSAFATENKTPSSEIPEGYTAIYTAEDLNNIRNNLSGKYILMNDIDLSGIEWMPIGTELNAFKGVLDGNGKTLNGLNITETVASVNRNSSGIFAFTNGATIKNLNISNVKVKISKAENDFYAVGIIVGLAKFSTVENCKVHGKADISVNGTLNIGGVIGEAFNTVDISKCENNAEIIADAKDEINIGGIVGSSDSIVSLSANKATITADNSNSDEPKSDAIYIGGICGNMFLNEIKNCYNTGDIQLNILSDSAKAGGIAGTSMYIKCCYNIGNIECNNQDTPYYTGGIVGLAVDNSFADVKISDCYCLNNISKAIGNSDFANKYNVKILSESEMKMQSSYVRFDFENVWKMDNEKGYPVLRELVKPENSPEKIPEGYTAIYTAEDLNNIRNNLSGKYILMNDIDLSVFDNWVPIGTENVPFTGVLDGNGYAVNNLKIEIVTDVDVYAGLFGYIEKGTVKNLFVINGKINVETSSDAKIGLISGETGYSNIKDCCVQGIISADSAQELSVGGMFGNTVFSKANKCASYSDIKINNAKGKCYVGGIVGYGLVSNLRENEQNRILNSYSHSSIKLDCTPNKSFIGGIAGICWYLENVYSAVTLDLPSEINGYIGSIVGSAEDTDYDYGAVMEPPVIANAFSLEGSLHDVIGFENTFSTIKNVPELSLEEMKKQESFVGFDFENIWIMDNEKGYPVLRKTGKAENNPGENELTVYLINAETIKIPFSKRIIFGTEPKSPEGIEIKLTYSNGDVITDTVRLSDDGNCYAGTEIVQNTMNGVLPIGKIMSYGIKEAKYFLGDKNVSISYKYLALPSIIEFFKNIFD